VGRRPRKRVMIHASLGFKSHRYHHPLRPLDRPVAGWPVTSRAARVGFDDVPARSRSVPMLPTPSRLYFRLIHLCSRASASCREEAPAQAADGADRARTLHRSPENRKVDGSTPPLATTLTSGNARLHRLVPVRSSHLSATRNPGPVLYQRTARGGFGCVVDAAFQQGQGVPLMHLWGTLVWRVCGRRPGGGELGVSRAGGWVGGVSLRGHRRAGLAGWAVGVCLCRW
jgi:hypothetical protein